MYVYTVKFLVCMYHNLPLWLLNIYSSDPGAYAQIQLIAVHVFINYFEGVTVPQRFIYRVGSVCIVEERIIGKVFHFVWVDGIYIQPRSKFIDVPVRDTKEDKKTTAQVINVKKNR